MEQIAGETVGEEEIMERSSPQEKRADYGAGEESEGRTLTVKV